jgi:hypothetical protein
MKPHHELAHSLQCKIYGDRGTDIAAAYDYLLELAKISNGEPAIVLTGAQVLVNTICNALLADEVKQ